MLRVRVFFFIFYYYYIILLWDQTGYTEPLTLTPLSHHLAANGMQPSQCSASEFFLELARQPF
jgi:hypothetical protein